MPNAKEDSVGGIIKGLVVILTLLAPIAGAMYIYFEGEARHARSVEQARNDFEQRMALLRREVESNRSAAGLDSAALDHHIAQQALVLAELRAALDEVRDRFDRHGGLGVDGLPHPAGVVARLKDIERGIALLSKSTDDRWRAKDMRAWVKLLQAQNEALQVPPVENGHN